MPTDLIFHLGLTKTASTFLQKEIFHGKMYTMDRSLGWAKEREDAKTFQQIFKENNPTFWSQQGKYWFDRYKVAPSLGSVIISHESLYEHVPFGDFKCLKAEPMLLAERLRSIDLHAWPHGQTKVWFFYRRQVEWLPSIYAQICDRLPLASQNDFDSRTKKFLASGYSGSHILDYDLLYESLKSALGEKNVLALPYEAISEDWVWEKVRSFTDEKRLIKNSLFDKRHVNVKRRPEEGESGWLLSSKAQRWGNLRTNSLLITIGQYLPSNVKSRIKKILFRNDLRVSISSELALKITEYYKESNIRLSSKTGIDLKKYGYF